MAIDPTSRRPSPPTEPAREPRPSPAPGAPPPSAPADGFERTTPSGVHSIPTAPEARSPGGMLDRGALIQARAQAAAARVFATAAAGPKPGVEVSVRREDGREIATVVRRDAQGQVVSVEQATRDAEGVTHRRSDWTGTLAVRREVQARADGTECAAVSEQWEGPLSADAEPPPGAAVRERFEERHRRRQTADGQVEAHASVEVELPEEEDGRRPRVRREVQQTTARDGTVREAREQLSDGKGRRVVAEVSARGARLEVEGKSLPLETAGRAQVSELPDEDRALASAALLGLAQLLGGVEAKKRRKGAEPALATVAAELLEWAQTELASKKGKKGEKRAAQLLGRLAELGLAGQEAKAGRASAGALEPLPQQALWGALALPRRERAGWRFGRYEVIKRLGMGGMGETLLARAEGAHGFTKDVVLKRLLPHLADDEEALSRFLSEARFAARLNHPNLVQLFELGEADGSWFLAMEHVDGLELTAVLRRARAQQEPIPLGVACRVVADVAAGLDHAHRARDAQGDPMGLVHRDVSPQNVLLAWDGAVKLIDFGIAVASGAPVSERGVLVGKVPYLAPEQVAGAGANVASDIFALGVVLWELLTNRRLFDAPTDDANLALIRQCRVVPPSAHRPEIPEALDAVCLRALRREPKERYPDAGALRRALEDLTVAHALPAHPSHLQTFLERLAPRAEEAEPELATPERASQDRATAPITPRRR